MKRGQSWGLIRVLRGPSPYNLKAHPLATNQDGAPSQELKGKSFDPGRPIEYADILQETKPVAQALRVPAPSGNLESGIEVGLFASSKKYSVDDQDFLNSFFVKDLGKLAAEVQKESLGKGS
jgi:hypothetical protein